MALRIGFDLDGVLADMDAALREHSERLFGTARGEAPPARNSEPADDSEEAATMPETPVVQLDLSVRQERQLWRQVSTVENFWEGLQEIEAGAIARLATLAQERA